MVEGFGSQTDMVEYEPKKKKKFFFDAGLLRAFDTLIFIMYSQYRVMVHPRISQRHDVQSSIFQMEEEI